MITQVIWTDVNNRELDTIYARVGDDEIREIQFIICRNDPPEKVAIPAGVSGQFRMIKSSGNFVVRDMVKTALEDGTVIFTVAVSDQMVNVQGTGYYDIRLSGGGYLYTASGEFIVDSAVISSGVLEDVSEVNGLVFPDDFLTIEDHVAYIDDDTVSTDSTWSSDKISEEIEAHAGGDVSKTVYGNPVIFTDGADAPLVKCVTAITGYQSGTGTPSPDNIRPIVAYTEGKIEVRGKNLYDKNATDKATGYYLNYNTGGVNASAAWGISGYIKCEPNTTYTISGQVSLAPSNYEVCFYDKTKTFISGINHNNMTFTTPNNDDVYYLRFDYKIVDIDGIQLESGSTPTTYEPYTSTTHTTTYPSAIYRGSEDVVNGEVTSEWVKETFDGTLHGIYTLISPGRLNIDIDISYQHNVGLPGKSVSSQYEELEQTSSNSEFDALASNKDGVYNLNANTSFKVIRIKDSRFTDLTTVISILARTPLEVAFQLATPTTSSVTPTNLPIKSLSGYNHIESSTGDMAVEYIPERFQPLIDSIKQL